MLYHLFTSYVGDFAIFNIFRYITFRTGGAVLTSVLLGLCIGPAMIAHLKTLQHGGQPIRADGPESHLQTKKGTPTMGGVIILASFFISCLLWSDLTNCYVWLILLSTLGFGLIGAYDDFTKLKLRSSNGIASSTKLLLQILVAGAATYSVMCFLPDNISTKLAVPFLKNYFIDLGVMYLVWGVFVMVGSSNAVNLTDGLDGLVSVPIILTTACFGLIAYLAGNQIFASYLHLSFISGVGELSTVCGAMIGATLAFLWFNAPPAQIFMGDTGSLSIGGMFGVLSIVTKHEFLLLIVGGLFVIETLSVIIQVISFKTTGKRVFLMAPLHHHFEKKGWSEATIVIRFWIIAIVCALLGLATIKLR